MMIQDALASLLRRETATDPDAAFFRYRRRAGMGVLCALASAVLAIGALAVLEPSVGRALIVAILLACPVMAIWGAFVGARPLPVPLGPIPATRGVTLNWIAPWYDSIWSPILGVGSAFRSRAATLVPVRKGDQILDAGCGTGWLTHRLARAVGTSGAVWGIDPAPDMIRIAMQQRECASHATFELGTLEALRFPYNSFDLVVVSLALQYLPTDLKAPALCEVHRVLKPGGRIFVAGLDKPRSMIWRLVLLPFHALGRLQRHLDGGTQQMLCEQNFRDVATLGSWGHRLTFWSACKP